MADPPPKGCELGAPLLLNSFRNNLVETLEKNTYLPVIAKKARSEVLPIADFRGVSKNHIDIWLIRVKITITLYCNKNK